MDILVTRERDSAQAKAFIVQYVAVMLILLTFVIGCFAGRPAQKPAVTPASVPQTPPASESLVPREWLKSQLRLDTIFTGDGMDEDKLSALAQFLSNHDIDADLEIQAPSLLMGIAQSRLLIERLTQSGVSPQVYTVSVSPAPNPAVVARLFRHREVSP